MLRKSVSSIRPYNKIAREMIDSGLAETGTMMGHPCLRIDGQFFATAGHTSDELIIKLPRERVDSLIASGVGEPFSPAGRVFREWVAIPRSHSRKWRGLMQEANEFVAHQSRN